MIGRRFTLFAAILAAVVIWAPLGTARDDETHSWTYRGDHGPEHWGDIDPGFATCKTGRHQSPIDIRDAKKSDLPAIQFDYQPTALQIINNGHTIQVNYAPGSFITVAGKRYELKQFHFHHPSEEEINGKDFAMVAHLVHADAQGNLAVVAVLLEPGASNQMIDVLWSHIPKQAGPEQKYDQVKINIADLLPADHGYYTFPGSLTTPPCSENVTWFVLKNPQVISRDQVEAFGKIYAHNSRPIQPLNDRKVLETK